MLRCLLFLSTISISCSTVTAQTITGSWYGRADVLVPGSSNNYLTEFILKQKGDEVEGIFGYYFKDSYQSFFVRGTYDTKTREVYIDKLPVLFHLSSGANGIECPMHFQGVLMVSQVKSLLRGYFYSEEKYKYTCPELRINLQMDVSETGQDSILKNTVTGKKFWKPQLEDFVVNRPGDSITQVMTQDVTVSNESVPANINPESEKKLIEKFSKRKNTYSKVLEIESDSIRVSFYDNGDIDGDSISVFLNKKPILTKQELTSRALNLYLSLDSMKEINEISMLAENLGKYPPNTALMVVSDGTNRYEVYLSSSLTQNASVRLKRKKDKTVGKR